MRATVALPAMLDRAAPLLILLLAGLLGWWLVGGDTDEPTHVTLPGPDLEPVAAAPVAPPSRLSATQPVAPAPGPVAPTAGPAVAEVPTPSLTADEIRALPRGELLIRVVDAAGSPRRAEGVEVSLASKGPGDWARRLPERDPTDAVFKYTEILEGQIEITIYGEAVAEVRRTVTVKADDGVEITIRTEDGAAAHFSIEMDDGSVLENATVSVLDEEGKAVEAWFEGTGAALRTVRKARSAELGATGRVYGLKPGRYTLQVAVAEAEEAREVFLATTGTPVSVQIRVRR